MNGQPATIVAALQAEEHDLKLNAVVQLALKEYLTSGGIGMARIPHLRGEMWGTRPPRQSFYIS
jgi:hypothetical protein